MLQKLDGVVLHVVRYSDKSNIVHIYTCQHGSMSFVIPATRSRKSLVNGALFRPLSLVEVEADVGSKIVLSVGVSALRPVQIKYRDVFG